MRNLRLTLAVTATRSPATRCRREAVPALNGPFVNFPTPHRSRRRRCRGPLLYFSVDDIQQAYDEVVAAGLRRPAR